MCSVWHCTINDVVSVQKHIQLIGLSKERPIRGDHAKAHIYGFHEIRWISHADFMKSGGFHADFMWIS